MTSCSQGAYKSSFYHGRTLTLVQMLVVSVLKIVENEKKMIES